MSPTPEQEARQHIDATLEAAGWVLQDRAEMNLSAAQGVAVREFKMADGHGFADYMLFVDGKAVGVLEAKPAGYPLTSVELQADKYATGLPAGLNPPVNPLPFQYMSTGVETRFINGLDPDPKTRRISDVPHIHRPSTLADWLKADTLDEWVKRLHADGGGFHTSAEDTRPSSLRSRLQTLPPLEQGFLFPNQVEAVTNLEYSLQRNRPRSLVQMATGSGKTIFAITSVYRLIKYAGARRVLFLVDRSNLGEQAEKEFQGFRTPDDNRKFTELYNVQRLTSNTIGSSSKVVDHDDPAPLLDAQGRARVHGRGRGGVPVRVHGERLMNEPLPSRVQPGLSARVLRRDRDRRVPPLDLLALAAGPGVLRRLPDRPHRDPRKADLRVLQQEPGDGVRPRARRRGRRERGLRGLQHPHEDHQEQGSTIEADARDDGRLSGSPDPRASAGRAPDEDITYDPNELDRRVVAKDQIRTVVRTFRDRLFTEIFPGRKRSRRR